MCSAGDEDNKAMANEGAKEIRNVHVGLGKKCFTVHELRVSCH